MATTTTPELPRKTYSKRIIRTEEDPPKATADTLQINPFHFIAPHCGSRLKENIKLLKRFAALPRTAEPICTFKVAGIDLTRSKGAISECVYPWLAANMLADLYERGKVVRGAQIRISPREIGTVTELYFQQGTLLYSRHRMSSVNPGPSITIILFAEIYRAARIKLMPMLYSPRYDFEF